MWLGSSLMIVVGTLLVWYINNLTSAPLDQNFSQIFICFIIRQAFIFTTNIQFDIGENIQDGKNTNKLLLPISTLKSYLFLAMGYQLFENVCKFLIYLTIGLVFLIF
jgi:ABC-type uncharacterized transport system permease subunit